MLNSESNNKCVLLNPCSDKKQTKTKNTTKKKKTQTQERV